MNEKDKRNIVKKRLVMINNVDNHELRNVLFKESIGKSGQNISIGKGVFFCTGSHIVIGDDFKAGNNVVFIDNGKIQIGNNCLMKDNVQLFTFYPNAIHSKRDILIGNNVVLEEKVVIYPGVEIGDNVVVTENSIVMNSIFEDK